MPSTARTELRPALPKGLADRLVELFFSDEQISDHNLRRLRDRERAAAEQARWERLGRTDIFAPLPGGNPEAASPGDAVIGLAMSMGGRSLPPEIYREQLPKVDRGDPARFRHSPQYRRGCGAPTPPNCGSNVAVLFRLTPPPCTQSWPPFFASSTLSIAAATSFGLVML